MVGVGGKGERPVYRELGIFISWVLISFLICSTKLYSYNLLSSQHFDTEIYTQQITCETNKNNKNSNIYYKRDNTWCN